MITTTILVWGTISAILLGVAKTGVPGVGLFGSLLMIATFQGHEMFASGAVVPLLILGDLAAVWYYGKDRQRGILPRIFPPLGFGLILGTVVLCFMNNSYFKLCVGILATGVIVFELLRERLNWSGIARSPFFGPFYGILAGLMTMLGNAAGPAVAAYFASLDLSKIHFMGTNSVFCFCMNTSKIPLLILATYVKSQMGFETADAQIITPITFFLTLIFAPGLLIGAILGRKLFLLIPEKIFVPLVLGLNFITAVHLLLSAAF